MSARHPLPSSSRTAARRVLAAGAVVVASAAASASPARAADDNAACVAAYEHSQILRREHKLARARDELRSCARAACPALVRNDCITWLDQVQSAFPSIAIRAQKDGNDTAAVKVTVDNEVVAMRLDGTSIEIEPGEHTFRFETDGAPPVVATIVVREKEKDRIVPVAFTSPHHARDDQGSPDATQPSRPIPAGVFVLGGIGIAGLATFAVLGAIGNTGENSLRGSCAPNCSSGSIGQVRTELVGADVGLGVGVGGLVAAGLWYLLRPADTEKAPEPETGLTAAPRRGGAVVGWSGSF